jgi:spore germination cell wall hydrolase CwlJ-like protein
LSTASAILLLMALSSSAQAKVADNTCLAYTAKREAENQSLRAVKGVIEVVQHRMQKQHKSCRAIVSRRGQFSWWRKNIKMKTTPDWLVRYEESRRMRPVLPPCADHFYSTDIEPPKWADKMTKVSKIGKLVYFCSKS